jgi:hypothetical protein
MEAKPQPQRCVVASCGREPTQIEYYETIPGSTDTYEGGSAGVAVCSGHTGIGGHKWRLAGVEPIPGRVHYAATTNHKE